MISYATQQHSTDISDLSSTMKALQTEVAAARDGVEAELRTQMESHVSLIPQISDYLINAGGKRIRPLLLLACCKLVGGELDKAVTLAVAVEFIHTATLLHDDVVDESDQRRNQRAAHKLFGNKPSILVGDFLFSRAFTLMVRCENLQILAILSQAATTIAEGEVMQLQASQDAALSRDSYLKIIDAKTAALFTAACQSGALIGGADTAIAVTLGAYGTALGRVFQIVDDVLDYEGDASMGKNCGDDFREGKVTLPVILAQEYALKHQDAEALAFWQRCINDPSRQTDTDLTTAQGYLKQSRSLTLARDIAEDYAQQASDSLTSLTDKKYSANLITLLQTLAESLPHRST